MATMEVNGNAEMNGNDHSNMRGPHRCLSPEVERRIADEWLRESVRSLAAKYRVSRGTIYNVIARTTP
jgi:Mor family transcriptional regulator